jgi:hypothetical protein
MPENLPVEPPIKKSRAKKAPKVPKEPVMQVSLPEILSVEPEREREKPMKKSKTPKDPVKTTKPRKTQKKKPATQESTL